MVIFIFKGMMGALAPFSYLVVNNGRKQLYKIDSWWNAAFFFILFWSKSIDFFQLFIDLLGPVL
jgi:hypothetical protein